MGNAELKLTTGDKSVSFRVAGRPCKCLEATQSCRRWGTSGWSWFRTMSELQCIWEAKPITGRQRHDSGDAWITQAGLENFALADALVAVNHGIDHVLPSVLHGLVEERRVVLVQDERGSPR